MERREKGWLCEFAAHSLPPHHHHPPTHPTSSSSAQDSSPSSPRSSSSAAPLAPRFASSRRRPRPTATAQSHPTRGGERPFFRSRCDPSSARSSFALVFCGLRKTARCRRKSVGFSLLPPACLLVLSFSRSLVLSFSRSLVLSFSRSLVLSFSQSLTLCVFRPTTNLSRYLPPSALGIRRGRRASHHHRLQPRQHGASTSPSRGAEREATQHPSSQAGE